MKFKSITSLVFTILLLCACSTNMYSSYAKYAFDQVEERYDDFEITRTRYLVMKFEKDEDVDYEIFYFIEFIENTFGRELYGYADVKVENKELKSISFIETKSRIDFEVAYDNTINLAKSIQDTYKNKNETFSYKMGELTVLEITKALR